MKTVLRVLFYLFLLIIVPIAIFLSFSYRKDIAVEDLQKKYSFEDSRYIDIMGMNAHYRVSGSGEPIVLLHGTGASLYDWEDWTKILDDHYQVISMDLPAFGLTGPHPDAQYSTEMYLEFIRQLLDKIGIEKAHFGGNSFGGYLSWNFALKYPEKVNKLILVNASGYPKDEEDKDILAFRLANSDFASWALQKITPRALIRKTLKDVFEDNRQVSKERINRAMDLLRRNGNRKAIMDRIRQLQYVNSEQIPQIKNPALILWGDKDKLTHVKYAQRYDQNLPNSKLIIYKNIGHVPMLEIPLVSAKDVLTFLKE